MSQILKAKVYVHMTFGYGPDSDFLRQTWFPYVYSCKLDDQADRIFHSETEIEVDITGFNPVPAQIAALEAEKAAATERFVKETASINERISKLLAIEHTPAAADDSEHDFHSRKEPV